MRGDFGPAKCPICGSVGARALMLDHIEAEHADLGAAWERTRWWRAIDENGQLRAESSDEAGDPRPRQTRRPSPSANAPRGAVVGRR